VVEISDNEKDAFLGNAYALLSRIDWSGPIVLVRLEAIAHSVLGMAYCHGSIPEPIEDGNTGFTIDGLKAARRAVEHIPALSQTQRRRLFEPRFNVPRRAEEYLPVYQRLTNSKLTHICAQ
jgi:glycosyltransferase involved in cell wall biosynthesis